MSHQYKVERRKKRILVGPNRQLRRYSLFVYFLGGPHRAYEKFLERTIVRRVSDGSGFHFSSGERDLSWSFVREASLRRAYRALLDVPGVKRVEVFDLDDPKTGKARRWKP